ncbi:MAG: sensor histidine kinase [Treponema sp.]|jgi:two-component system sensor histidine kinase YesM|nr:sensor histidine kinase [Treponema sp.]
MTDSRIGGRIQKYSSGFRNYLDFLKIDKKLLTVCILSLFVPIMLSGIYFLTSFAKLTRENEFRQARNNVEKMENQLVETLGKAVDIANRIYANPHIQRTVAAEYESPLEIYNAYGDIYFFDDYLRSYKEIAGIRLYVENPTMLDNSYFIVTDDEVRRESWYETAKALDGKMFWTYRHDAIRRLEYISLIRQIRNTTTGAHVGILCIHLDMKSLEQICAAELHDTLISLNGRVIYPAGQSRDNFTGAGNWIITNSFTPRSTLNSIFDITYIIPRKTLFLPVYSMIRKSLVIIFVSLAVSLIFILQIVNEVYVQKLQKEQLFSHQKEMQLKILSSQINPHFLYNTLETIRMMALGKKETTIAATIKMLSQLLRQSLSANDKTIPLEKELELVRNYLAIQKLRFSNRMDYSLDTEPGLGGCSILPLLVQPLVENSLIHGLETKPEGGYIRISVKPKDKTLCIDVSDNGTGMEPEYLEKLRGELVSGEDAADGRIGLVNVNRRIKLYYGPGFGLSLSENTGKGIKVNMIIPLVRENVSGPC